MVKVRRWEKYQDASAFLVSVDISGYSKDIDYILNRRWALFKVIQETPLFHRTHTAESVKVHFLGDELRLAFLVNGAKAIRDFLNQVFVGLDKLNKGASEKYQTRIKGAVLRGVVTWKEWHKCDYLNGALPIKAQTWMRSLGANEVVIDKGFRDTLEMDGVPTRSLTQKRLPGEVGYLLRS